MQEEERKTASLCWGVCHNFSGNKEEGALQVKMIGEMTTK
jgi:hypothetical protein